MKPKIGLKLTTMVSAMVLAIVASVVLLFASPVQRSFRFVTEDHPIDRWNDGKDRWAYFSIGRGKTQDLAARARAELTPQGFAEDNSKRPWFRFVKGNQEVVICNHDEFGLNGTSGHQQAKFLSLPGTHSEWPCVLVKNGQGTEGNFYVFQAKKLVFRW